MMMPTSRTSDEPYALEDNNERKARRALLQETRIAPLTALVEQLRANTNFGPQIPYFDPLDGGVEARCLFLLEAPGRRAVESGFISRNNPDPTARNFCILLHEAEIPREDTVLWNIVPWYIGSGRRIRRARGEDVTEGVRHLPSLLKLLAHLRIIVLAGEKAQFARKDIARLVTAPIVNMLHPSNLVLNRRPENRSRLLAALKEVRSKLTSPDSNR